MKEKTWIGIDNLEQMKVSGNDKVVLLLEDKDGYRKLTVPYMNTNGKWKICDDRKVWNIIAYYVVRTINFCCFSPGYKHTAPELQGKGMVMALWGCSFLAKTCMQVTDFKDGHIVYGSLWPDVQPPDFLLGWSVLPDKYDYQKNNIKE